MTPAYPLHEIVSRSKPIKSIEDCSSLIEKLKDKKVVMLGESSHGTKEFYEWRSLISRELVEKHGFNFISVEGDWPPGQEVNRYIQGQNELSDMETLARFSRWPSWMWANTQVLSLMDWMREWNDGNSRPAGFHGLDVYSLYESLDEVVNLIRKVDQDLAFKLTEYYSCFDPYRHDEKSYARSLMQFPEGCEDDVTQALQEMLKKNIASSDFFDAIQNATIVKNAENYYRAMVFSQEDDSWNVRDRHMMDTLEALLDHYGADSKGIVWAHNTHIGDYRATDMVTYGHVNIGGLCREKLGAQKVGLVGFTTHRGSVIASHAWEGPIQVLEVPSGRPDSVEHMLKEASSLVGSSDYWLDLSQVDSKSPLQKYKGHRAIGVVYWPEHESRGNYVPTSLAQRYDAMVFVEETSALTPLQVGLDRNKIPETYPFGARM